MFFTSFLRLLYSGQHATRYQNRSLFQEKYQGTYDPNLRQKMGNKREKKPFKRIFKIRQNNSDLFLFHIEGAINGQKGGAQSREILPQTGSSSSPSSHSYILII